MNTIRHLKGNFIVSGVGIGVGLLTKQLLKKEIIAVSTTAQITKSYFFILGTTIVGKMLMDKFHEKYWVPHSAGGKDKVENEGFIGPLQGDLIYLISPNRWDNRANSDRWNIHGN